MRIVFAGTPVFAVAALDALHAAGHEIVGVYTQPDRPAGRGRKLTASPVAERAGELGLPVFKPPKLDAEAQAPLRALAPEVMVVVAYGLLLPQAVLDIPAHGCLNIHGSLLPRWRGAAPIARAIEAGDTETGITIMRMDAGLDTGPMLLMESCPISERDTAATLHDTLAAMGARMIVDALARLAAGTLQATPQPTEGATYARKLSKEEARLDWTQDAQTLARRVRAFNPAPGAWCELEGEDERERLRMLFAHAREGDGGAAPGTVPGLVLGAAGLQIACGHGVLVIEQVQWPGGKPQILAPNQPATHAGQPLAGRRFI